MYQRLFPSSSSLLYTARSYSQAVDSIKPFKSLPGPRPLPFIGNLMQAGEFGLGKVGEDHLLSKMARKYGDIFKLSFGNESYAVISDANCVKTVFNNEGKLPIRSMRIEKSFKWIHDRNKMPMGLASSYQEEWKHLRSSMIKQVMPQKLTHFVRPLALIADDLCEHLENCKDSNGWITDIWDPLKKWAMKGSAKVVFNEEMDCFSGKDSQSEEFMTAVLKFIYHMGKINEVLPLYKIYPTQPYRDYISSFNKARALGKELVSNHYNQLLSDIEAGTVDEDRAIGLLDQWLIEGKLTEDEALVQACDMLAAGIDTTSNTATFMLHELAKNQDIQKSVRNEVMEVVGTNAHPTSEELQKLSLVRKCVKETLRLYPLLPIIPRRVANDIDVLGYRIPEGTTCMFNYFIISVDPRYFKDPLKFDPDRWSHDAEDTHPFASLPFGFGPRSCYGRRIAELELHLLLTRILQRFQLSTDQDKIKYCFHTVLRPNEPVRMKLI